MKPRPKLAPYERPDDVPMSYHIGRFSMIMILFLILFVCSAAWAQKFMIWLDGIHPLWQVFIVFNVCAGFGLLVVLRRLLSK